MEDTTSDFYRELTNYELADLQSSLWQGLGVNFSLFITVLSAYIVLAYFEGKNLSKFQLVSVSVLYSTFQLMMLGFINDGFTKVLVIEELMSGSRPRLIGALLLLVLFASWITSIIFMQQARKSI